MSKTSSVVCIFFVKKFIHEQKTRQKKTKAFSSKNILNKCPHLTVPVLEISQLFNKLEQVSRQSLIPVITLEKT